MKRLLILATAALTALSAPAAAPAPSSGTQTNANPAASTNPFELPETIVPAGRIDELVLTKLATAQIQPALCSDAVFVRRVFLDTMGTLPTAEEARKFIEDQDRKNKRRKLIDQLLERKEYADYWAMKWGDVLRIKAEFPVNLWPNAAQAYHRWVRAAIAENKPYDKFARELLTSSGSNFRVGPVNFYRAVQNRTPEGIAGAVALTLMGTRTDTWTKEKLEGLAAFFSQIGYKATREWKEEDVFWDPLGISAQLTNTVQDPTVLPVSEAPSVGVLPDGKQVRLLANRDPREEFADWLITPRNPWFTRAIANRTWAWLLGRGIVHEPDDIRDDNPASIPELLVYLEQELITNGYDLKKLQRLILNSSVYQFSSLPHGDATLAEKYFGAYQLRRLDAEVLIDAINKITGTTDLYTSAIPEPFTYIPADQPAIAIADGSITSPFLALFGRSARATGLENERINRLLPAHYLHLLNSSHIQRKIDQGPKLKALFESGRKPAQIVDDLYLSILSRYPTPDERKALEEFGRPGRAGARTKAREDWVDISWSLVNSTEFLFRH